MVQKTGIDLLQRAERHVRPWIYRGGACCVCRAGWELDALGEGGAVRAARLLL